MTIITACFKNDSDTENRTILDNSNEDLALLIIDVQNDYFDGGRHKLYRPSCALTNVEFILNHFREKNISVIHVQHVNPVGAGFFEPNTWGVRIHERLTPSKNEPVIVKNQISSFDGTELGKVLTEKGIKRLVICGMQTNVCVEATTKDAKERGFEVTLLQDASAALDPGTHNNAIDSLRGSYAAVLRTVDYFIQNY